MLELTKEGQLDYFDDMYVDPNKISVEEPVIKFYEHDAKKKGNVTNFKIEDLNEYLIVSF